MKSYWTKGKDFIRLFKVKSLLNISGGASDLTFILNQFHSELSLEKKTYWLEELIIWISDSNDSLGTKKTDHHVPIARLSYFLDVLNNHLTWKREVAKVLRDFLRESSTLSLFSQSGLVQETGLWSETMDRILHTILPKPLHESEMSDFFSRIFTSEFDVKWIEALPADLVIEIVDLINFEAEPGVYEPLKQSMADSLILLGNNVASLGLSADVRKRLEGVSVSELPFYQLRKKLEEFSENVLGGSAAQKQIPLIDECLILITDCRRKVHQTLRHLEQSGVSVNLVYRLDHIGHCLTRIETLLHLFVLEMKPETMSVVTYFLADLVRDGIGRRGIVYLFQNNMRMIAKKIVERAGDSGEHYITRSKSEYFAMLASAGGGGALTVLTMLLKYVITKIKLPVFIDGMATWLNYSTGFITMQLVGFTLATKQPSYTASTLAGMLNNTKKPEGVREFVDEFVKTARSQFAAVLGNLGVAIPFSFLVDFVFNKAFGHHIFDTKYAEYTIATLHPYQSLTILYAAETGVMLWMASVAGGWLDNWMVYREIPLAIEKHRILNFAIGPQRCAKISHWLTKNMTGIGSNLALGFLLAFVPIFGKFMGLPFDVRHVTLSSCALVFSFCALWTPEMPASQIIISASSLLIIGLMNFGVSFYLALNVAARARAVDSRVMSVLFRHILKRFFVSPLEFIYPFKSQTPTQNG
ncbi:MAG: hypothetical protein AB7F59_13660 [Bdellovibrionales bacterium]